MNKPDIEVVGIGNAIVDVLSFCKDAFLEEHGLNKGTMALIDEARAEALYESMGPAKEVSGGSVANSMAGIASLGGKAAFIGKVKDDQFGKVFRHDMKSVGVHFTTAPATEGKGTARSYIFVTPDAQRTMNTFLGACTEVREADIDEALIAAAQVVFIEGYLWDQEDTKRALRRAAELAHKHKTKVALSLSDPFCVERHRDEFLELIHEHVDILFANEKEIESLYKTDDFHEAESMIKGKCEIACLTRSEHGSVIITQTKRYEVAARLVDKVVDSTGAGDLYAAGFLYGYTHKYDPESCANLGSICAAEIVQTLGARTMKPLADVVNG